MDGPFAATVDVSQSLEGSTVRGIMIPYRKFEQDCTEGELNFVRPVFP
jgi:hypothetical protein